MSYGVITPCWNCQHNNVCKDSFHISEGVQNIYKGKPEEHKGCGNVVICCAKLKPITE